jgi:hypothetical protein
MNSLKSTPAENAVTEKKGASIKSILTGQFLTREKALEVLPFIFFITFLGICYIANGYQAERLIRELYNTTAELKELRSEYITAKSDLMYISKQSQVARATAELGLKELTSPPKKIVVGEDELKMPSHD